ncbi:MAG: hypothetical protein CM1200mP12_01790 [Gammaproteobacteria bacterium]|nr:MAG: hypothetical protein CM1200mP12_01790 [Gammaproteobacteria bacterium]
MYIIYLFILSRRKEHKGNHEVNMNESPLEGVKFSFIKTQWHQNALAEMGEGPLVLLAQVGLNLGIRGGIN